MNRRERRAQWQASHRQTASRLSVSLSRSPLAAAPARRRSSRLRSKAAAMREAWRFSKPRRTSSPICMRTAETAGALPDALRHRMTSSSLRLAPLTLRRASDPVAIGEQLAASVFAFERESRRRGGPR